MTSTIGFYVPLRSAFDGLLNEILDPSGSSHSILYVPLAPRVPNSALRRHALAAGQDALCLRSTRIVIEL